MTDEINIHLKQVSTWQRIFYMLVVIINIVISPLLVAVVLLQIITTLLTGDVNSHILAFGRSLSAYLYHITLYLSFNTEQIPFPFSNWQTTEQFDLATNEIKSDDLS
jgi:hypothetical protein